MEEKGTLTESRKAASTMMAEWRKFEKVRQIIEEKLNSGEYDVPRYDKCVRIATEMLSANLEEQRAIIWRAEIVVDDTADPA